MEYISLDLETTGIDTENHQILEVGAIYEDTLNPKSFENTPKFHCIINHYELVGSPFALNMNHRILDILANRSKHKNDALIAYDDKHNIIKPFELRGELYKFIYNNIKAQPTYSEDVTINLAGKNVARFDLPFLENHFETHRTSNQYNINFNRRYLDPAIMFSDLKLDQSLPNLSTCLERAGLPSTVTHNAVEDAWQVVQLLRTKY